MNKCDECKFCRQDKKCSVTYTKNGEQVDTAKINSCKHFLSTKITNYAYFKKLVKNKKLFIQWLSSIENESSPWVKWFNEKYCLQCCIENTEMSYCEHNGCCVFFKDYPTPNSLDVIDLWLKEEK